MFADIQKYVKIVELFPNEVLTEDKISKEGSAFAVALPSNGNLDALVYKIKFDNPSSLGAVDAKDMKLYNSQNLTAFDNPFMKLYELSDDVGSISNPLVLCYQMKNVFSHVNGRFL